ncbi:SRPBCC family protein [Fulvivirgaceae bacterium BMA10]|uniref:SRPBCC family protein n=1 Tax=Splendidivirga corallicola TaxID=3051826 RepID=A0ABT8KTH7_9BACT|nr:SRPBCC family protein [Fulvivirgaceae bacterium BMA10]
MKYTNEIEIDLPVEKVIALFDNPDNMSKWQPELLSFEHISGEPGQVGAKSKLLYQMGKRKIEMIETITKRDLPQEFAGTYEAKGVKNWINNRFVETTPDKTKWISDNEFKFSGFMSVMGPLMGSKAFSKQSMKYMVQFKEFAESVEP